MDLSRLPDTLDLDAVSGGAAGGCKEWAHAASTNALKRGRIAPVDFESDRRKAERACNALQSIMVFSNDG
jgi:hypothetical protein